MINKKIQDMILFEIKKRKMTFEEVISIIENFDFFKENLIENVSLEKLDILFNIILKKIDIKDMKNYRKEYYTNDCNITQIIDKELQEICFFISQEEEKNIIDIYCEFLNSDTYSKITDFNTKYYQKYIGEIINDYLIELDKNKKSRIII